MAAGCGSKVAAAQAIEGGDAAAGGSVPQAIRGETAQWVPPSAEQPLWATDPFFSELSPQVLAAPGVASAGRHTKTKARVWAAVTPVSGVPIDGGGACVPCRRGSGTFLQSRRDIQ